MASSSQPRPTAGLVLIRVAAGALLTRAGLLGLPGETTGGAYIRDSVEAALPDLPGLARWWGESVLLENPDAIAFLWKWLVLAVGLGLVFGALTRPLGAIGTLLMLNAWLFGAAESALLHLLLAACCFGCFMSGAGRFLGLDLVLDASLAQWLTWAPKRKRGW
ncbi:DoxX family membrane protein [Engelhardtia mirabilis]|uniref:DoxX n=1 Tax=Engelhardtia mirabilis TaxID=2528011 RepID=A0A518BIK5_9BACT|nr:hypothetical protein Pla133_18720 [Planctomycetes bacterium Pla133]QDV01122.1 hypothetical protein Pla86_18710 [Planctomycetes bacterium Pla86]